MSLDLLSVVLIIAIAQGLFTLSLLILRYKLKPFHNILLFLLILVFLWFQAEFLFIRSAVPVPIKLFYGTRHGAWLLLGPLYYFYVRGMLYGKTISTRLLVLSFAPFFVFAIIIPLLCGEFLGFHQVHYGMISPFYPINRHVTLLQGLYTAVFIIQFIS